MKIALDPFMHRHLSLDALPAKVRELGYDWIELSRRGDFLEWFKAPRVFPERIRTLKTALKDAGVGIASLLPMYRWASNDEVERLAAVRHWKRAIEICLELEVDAMNSESGRGPHPEKGSCYCCDAGSMIEVCVLREAADHRRRRCAAGDGRGGGVRPSARPGAVDNGTLETITMWAKPALHGSALAAA